MPLSQQYIESDDDSSRDRSASPKTSSAAKGAKKSKTKRAPSPSESDSDDAPAKKKSKKGGKKGGSGSPPAPKDKKPIKGVKDDAPRKVGAARRASTELQTNDNGEQFLDLGKNKRVTVSQFKKSTLVQIREYYMGDDGEMKPGKKGIALSVEQWDRLKKGRDSVDEAIDNLA
ncbi:transcriptional coactivator p15/PC4 family protein [Rhodotorula paludigena]|uniref:transcriptional coactivator p15/PC4 family protein n=1 Tax=Rhodotorula paludigena TaxID=86838 RepID=UPI003175DB2F